jgi:putative transposase
MKPLIITCQSHSKEEIQRKYDEEKNVDMARKYQAIFLLMEGKSKKEVARTVRISKRQLLRWIHAYNKHGIDGLKPVPKPGRPGRLTAEQKQELDADLQKNPRELGYDFSIWDGKKLKYHIEHKFGVEFKVRRVQKIMHELDYSLQRPRPVLAKADPAKQEAFKIELDEKKGQNSSRMMSSFT